MGDTSAGRRIARGAGSCVPSRRRRPVDRLKNSPAAATRYVKRAYVFHGTVTVTAVRSWLRP